ncbi:hypothetical protein MLD38_004906 [Melastoma candidum]|uniref:Uncharacterized protein n=1 Tax=Melastoma candidum TaxID=119954 RepID=A0ACB9S732_9MYRT|nr:hypothetical protein MLD38_004906 [Melastoma candidum]
MRPHCEMARACRLEIRVVAAAVTLPFGDQSTPLRHGRHEVSLFIIFLSLFSRPAFSGWSVTELPGFSGTLPFKLETGYVSVGDVEFFYYFMESEGNPRSDPVLLYMNGGPGCSGLNGLFYQIGPLRFNITDYDGGLPTLIYEQSSWTKTSSIIFVDAPVGAGFSYATTASAYNSTDTLTTTQLHSFLLKWMEDHPAYQTNRLYIGSDSYAGVITPMLVKAILQGNEEGLTPYLRISGYVLSCPHTYTDLETNSKISYAHRMALISDTLYQAAKTSCSEDYANPTTASCEEDLAAIDQCTELINKQMIIEPNCAFLSPESNRALQSAASKQEKRRRLLWEFNKEFLLSLPRPNDYWCKNFEYLLSDIWGNYPSVQDALHGTVSEFHRCNVTLEYSVDVNNVLDYHKNLTSLGMQVLVVSGDHDMVIPHNGIEEWIASFDLTIDTDWRPWFIDGQVAGYTRKYTNSGYRLTYATVKGAGHSPMEFKRSWLYDMFQRWIHFIPIVVYDLRPRTPPSPCSFGSTNKDGRTFPMSGKTIQFLIARFKSKLCKTV